MKDNPSAAIQDIHEKSLRAQRLTEEAVRATSDEWLFYLSDLCLSTAMSGDTKALSKAVKSRNCAMIVSLIVAERCCQERSRRILAESECESAS